MIDKGCLLTVMSGVFVRLIKVDRARLVNRCAHRGVEHSEWSADFRMNPARYSAETQCAVMHQRTGNQNDPEAQEYDPNRGGAVPRH